MVEFNGILPLFKPRGMTSHDCIDRLRRLLKFKKIGHTGTLDPEVDGVLPICLGRATKTAQFLTDYPKSYAGLIRLGFATTTEDQTGEIIEKKCVTETLTRATIEAVLSQFSGEIEQTPPMYSAVKVNGRKLYEYAREGLAIERPTRKVTIHKFLLNSEDVEFREQIPFLVDCSKGTYVRTLAVDIGKALGYPAHLERLTRVRSGPFTLKDCLSFETIEQAVEENRFTECLSSIAYGLKHMASWVVDDQTAEKIMNGAVLDLPKGFQNGIFVIYNRTGECLAIYRQHPTKPSLMKPEKVLIHKENSRR